MSDDIKRKKLLAKFNLLDENMDGEISLEEFAGFCADMDIDPLEVSNRFRAIDTNNDGKISYEEFLEAIPK